MPVTSTIDASGIFTVTISRPEAMNALNNDTINQLYKVIEEISKNLRIKGVIITGEGDKAFVAGADIRELAELSPDEAFSLAKRGQELFQIIEDCPKPIIAAVNGFALGGGCELAMACHMRLASRQAKFGQPEINLGIIPGYGGTQRLTRLIGKGKAFELLMTGSLIGAEEAHALGLVNHVYEDSAALLKAATKLMETIIQKSPLTLSYLIKAVNAEAPGQAGFEQEALLFRDCATTSDFKEGTSAFLEKRKPQFSGK